MPGKQFLRYLCVGVFNTVFGYLSYAITYTFIAKVMTTGHAYLAAPAAALLSTPVNITVAYVGYKFFVFRTRGNYVREWLKAFGVYGVGMLPGLLALSAITRGLQSLFHQHGVALHSALSVTGSHLAGASLHFLQNIATAPRMAGYIAGALVQIFTVVFGYFGHKKVTFRQKPA